MHAAGTVSPDIIGALDEAAWAKVVDVNLTAHARLVRLALPMLRVSDAARVVNIASTEAIVAAARPADATIESGFDEE